MSVLVTMRVNIHDFEGNKQAVAKYGAVRRVEGLLAEAFDA